MYLYAIFFFCISLATGLHRMRLSQQFTFQYHFHFPMNSFEFVMHIHLYLQKLQLFVVKRIVCIFIKFLHHVHVYRIHVDSQKKSEQILDNVMLIFRFSAIDNLLCTLVWCIKLVTFFQNLLTQKLVFLFSWSKNFTMDFITKAFTILIITLR